MGDHPGGEAVSPRAFRTALGTFPTGVAIVTFQTGDGPHGMTVNSLVSLSLDPPLIGISVDRRARSAELIERVGRFAVNVASAGQRDLAVRFATNGLRGEELFAGVDWTPGYGGAPILAGCLAAVDCDLHSILPTGDHLLYLGEVRIVHLGPAHLSPVVFHRSTFTGLRAPYGDHPFLHLPPSSPDWAMS
ncbi:flavin reductase family protein [Polymorphospora sp. NPDC050346]|uniref:flavin reductase family protein n=1 Tax=Polymorphospora sp. NPDC050346 TaxID=3155780 RepID=UPI0033C47424